MDKTKYNRVAEDKQQLQQFAEETIEKINAGGGGTKLYKHSISVGSNNLTIINFDSASFTFSVDSEGEFKIGDKHVKTLFSEALIIYQAGEQRILDCFIDYTTSDLCLVWIDAGTEPVLDTSILANATDWMNATDTVTEL